MKTTLDLPDDLDRVLVSIGSASLSIESGLMTTVPAAEPIDPGSPLINAESLTIDGEPPAFDPEVQRIVGRSESIETGLESVHPHLESIESVLLSIAGG